MYSTGKADASYSAAMAEANLSDWTFQYWRKWAERYLLDWEFEQAVEWAMRTGAVPNKPMLDIIGNVGWAGWPERGAINPSQEANAKKVRLSIGDLTYEDMIGPDAYDKLAAQGDLLKRLRDAGFFPEQHTFNSASGGGNGQ
jgi:capsid protein